MRRMALTLLHDDRLQNHKYLKCFKYLFSPGPSIESAYLSGSLLADSLADRFNSGTKKDYGLDPKERFQVMILPSGHKVKLLLFTITSPP